ncbi:MAG TPA: SRPBCC family protein [Baekduia sp.]|uniref:SRPBCC family protein n=1 Tax=Baekduia sp. TaxID=2600305 RepID=UPI002D7882BC|nr:SRPBCC family protein [Baekduia sp.]HET6506580.1 SRPBCC family protein [Baekduia sp.]
MAYALKPIGDEWFETAPLVVPATVELDAPVERVWEALGSDAMWSWAPIIDRVEWITPRPHAAGSIRRLRMFKVNTISEEFYRWDEGVRATFRVTHQTRRMLDGLAEDFALEARPGGGTALTWTMAIGLKGAPAPPAFLKPALIKGNAVAIGGIKKIL